MLWIAPPNASGRTRRCTAHFWYQHASTATCAAWASMPTNSPPPKVPCPAWFRLDRYGLLGDSALSPNVFKISEALRRAEIRTQISRQRAVVVDVARVRRGDRLER